MCVGSFINLEKPPEDVNENNFNPCLVFIPSDHQEYLELKFIISLARRTIFCCCYSFLKAGLL